MADSAAEYLEIRWRVKGSGSAWSAPHRVGVSGDVVVQNLDQSKQYEFEARSVSNCGAKSVWVSSDYTPPGVDAPPEVTSLTAQSLADGVHLGWTFAGQWSGLKFSVERSTSATTGFSECAQVLTTSYTDPETTGTTHYYRVRAQSVMGGYGPYSNVVSSKGVSVDKLGDDVAAAQEAADDAQDSANAALDKLDDIASDNILSSAEKPVVIRDYDVITTEQAGIDAQATAYSITTEKTAYDSKVSALTSYLDGLTDPKAWNDKSGNTTIVGTTFRAKFNDVYTARQTLLNAIYAKAKSLVNTAQSSANRALAALTIQNPVFHDGLTGWESFSSLGFIASGEFYVETGEHGFPNQGTYLVHKGQAGQTWAGMRTHAMQCAPGENVTAVMEVKDASADPDTGADPTPSANASASAVACLFWYDHTGAKIGDTVEGNPAAGPGGDYLQCVSKVSAVAPANAFSVKVGVQFDNHTSGYLNATNFRVQTQPASLDDVPDSSTRYAAAENGADKTSNNTAAGIAGQGALATQSNVSYVGNQLIDKPLAIGSNLADHETFFDGIGQWVNEAGRIDGINNNTAGEDGYLRCTVTSTNVSSGNQNFFENVWRPVTPGETLYFAANLSAAVSTNTVWIGVQFDTSVPTYTTVGQVAAGQPSTATSGSVTVPSGARNVRIWAAVVNGVIADAVRFSNIRLFREVVMTAGSGARLGNIENQTTFGWASFGTMWTSGTLSYNATSTNAVITASAGTLSGGSVAINYSASSMNMAGFPGQHRQQYFYYNDAPPLGGSHPIRGAYDSVRNIPSSDHVVFIGGLTVVYPSSGSGTGSGTRPCVSVDSFVVIRRGNTQGPMRAGLIKHGDEILCCIPQTGYTWWEPITQAHTAFVRGVVLHSARGARLTCSHDAAIADLDGRKMPAETLRGVQVPSWDGAGHHLDHVDAVTDAGAIEVMKISSGNNWFLAGDVPGYYVAHHNQKKGYNDP